MHLLTYVRVCIDVYIKYIPMKKCANTQLYVLTLVKKSVFYHDTHTTTSKISVMTQTDFKVKLAKS